MPTANTDEAQQQAIKRSFERGVFPPKIEISFVADKNDKLASLKKEFKRAKKALKISKENLRHLKLTGQSKKNLAKAKYAIELAKSKKASLESEIKVLTV